MRRGKPFLEILAMALRGDYKFPIFEVLAILFTLSTVLSANFGGSVFRGAPEELSVFSMTNSLLTIPRLILMILFMKNIAFGLGNDLESGSIRTLLIYPIKRRTILTTKLLSALGTSILLFISIQLFALYVLAPEMVLPNLGTILLVYLADLNLALFIASVTLLMTLLLKKGSWAIVIGIILFFFFAILQNLVSFIAQTFGSHLPQQLYSLIWPTFALENYYFSLLPEANIAWTPSFLESLSYIGIGYGITVFIFFLAYFYLSRRLDV